MSTIYQLIQKGYVITRKFYDAEENMTRVMMSKKKDGETDVLRLMIEGNHLTVLSSIDKL